MTQNLNFPFVRCIKCVQITKSQIRGANISVKFVSTKSKVLLFYIGKLLNRIRKPCISMCRNQTFSRLFLKIVHRQDGCWLEQNFCHSIFCIGNIVWAYSYSFNQISNAFSKENKILEHDNRKFNTYSKNYFAINLFVLKTF